MPYAKLNDLNMFYEEFGRGETVLFLHSHFSRGLLAFSGQKIQDSFVDIVYLFPDKMMTVSAADHPVDFC